MNYNAARIMWAWEMRPYIDGKDTTTMSHLQRIGKK